LGCGCGAQQTAKDSASKPDKTGASRRDDFSIRRTLLLPLADWHCHLLLTNAAVASKLLIRIAYPVTVGLTVVITPFCSAVFAVGIFSNAY
jgi:hypothetical protein